MTRPGRDPGIDALRVWAMGGVILGHWLVTGLVTGTGGLRTASPLTAMPWAAPATWLFQTLGLFFFAAGFASTRSRTTRPRNAGPLAGPPHTAGPLAGPTQTVRLLAEPARTGPTPTTPSLPGPTPAARCRGGRLPERGRGGLGRTARGVGVLVGGWGVALAVGAVAGVPFGTLRTVAVVVVSPLWFLGPYVVLRAGGGFLREAVRRFVVAAVVPAVAVVALVDGGVLPGVVSGVAAWSVPWMLGTAVARGRFGSRRDGALLAAGGGSLLLLLVTVGHYPVSAVGVPGDGRSNLAPPSLAAVALAAAQIGIFLLIRRTGGPPRAWVTRLNDGALPAYLWHQSVLLIAAGLGTGLIGAPDDGRWVLTRLAWLPGLTAGLAMIVLRAPGHPGGGRHHRAEFLKWRLRSTVSLGSRRPTTDGGDRCAR